MKHKHTNIGFLRPAYDNTFSSGYENQEKQYELNIKLIQPWSVPILKTTLPPDILQTMIEISDKIVADKNAESHGKYLVGQIDTELRVKYNILKEAGVLGFLLGTIRQFVIICKCQMNPHLITEIQQMEWMTDILSTWLISQQPGEYNPMHVHTECDISSVMYLKVPKILPSRKEYKPNQFPHDDGSILFVSNASRDLALSVPSIAIPPQVGDFYIFGAQQQHSVYPYRCEEGQKDVERRSLSFNAIFKGPDDKTIEKD